MTKSKLFLILYAITTGIYINLIGRLMVAEVLAIFSLSFINIRRLLGQYMGLKVVLGSLIVLLFIQILSDIVNNSAPYDYLRGWSVIVFSMITIIFLVNNLSKSNNGIVYYLFAIMLLYLFVNKEPLDLSMMEENTNFFKIRFVGFLNPAMTLLAYFFYSNNKSKYASLVFLFYGLICMSFDARSNGIIFILAGILLYIKATRIRISGNKFLMLSILTSGILYASYVYYVNQVLYHDFGGNNAKIQLHKASNPYNPFELLYYGRSEAVVLIYAGFDKPILGHGSWAHDPNMKYALLQARLADGQVSTKHNYIHAHSILFGYFAYAGIFGFLSILFLFFKLFSYVWKIYKSNLKVKTLPIIIVLSIDMLWAFFFSPIGTLRTTFPIFASLVIVEYMRYEFYISNLTKMKLKKT